jgi:hypothetical protein
MPFILSIQEFAMRMRSRQRFGAGTLFAAAAISAPALSQVVPPPVHNSRSATGISYRGGAFSFEEEDLSVAGGMPNGLALTRSYNSSTMPVADPYGNGALGWTNNFDIYVTSSQVPHYPMPDGFSYPSDYNEVCIYSVSGGSGSTQFATGGGESGGRTGFGCGGNVPGTYVPVVATGQKLEYVTTDTPNHWRFTNSDGSVINFNPWSLPKASNWTMPDGTRLDFNYSSSQQLQSVFSNRGWAVLFESQFKTCIVNTAQTYVTAASACPAGAQTATYSYTPGTYNTSLSLISSATIDGHTRTYQYVGADHVGCIIDPGQTACRIQNTYGHCPEDPQIAPSGIETSARISDPVNTQQDGSGRTYTYTYTYSSGQDLCPQWERYSDPTTAAYIPDYRPWEGVSTAIAETGISGTTTVSADDANQVGSITDPLGHQTGFSYDDSVYSPDSFAHVVASGELTGATFPEGNQMSYGYDARANQNSSTAVAKPGSGLANIGTSSSFPTTCTNVITCNKPSSTTDARGNVTSYTYDPTQGGVLTETGPADSSGINPVKRYSYVQRSAWLANGSGGYSASPYPVWLINDMRTCRTTATVGNACAGGSADEVVTTYDYGPNSGPNNLLVRGVVVTADGTSRRTCYAYDVNGRKISETKPNANLTACP